MSQFVLNIRSSVGGWLYALGLIKRTTCFKWEMDRSLGEWS